MEDSSQGWTQLGPFFQNQVLFSIFKKGNISGICNYNYSPKLYSLTGLKYWLCYVYQKTLDTSAENSKYPLQLSLLFESLQLVRCRPDKELGRTSIGTFINFVKILGAEARMKN